jgi:hypothetical protein
MCEKDDECYCDSNIHEKIMSILNLDNASHDFVSKYFIFLSAISKC